MEKQGQFDPAFFNHQLKMTADMSDSVKQKRSIHCPCFLGGFSFHMQGISD
jgi:hypothetical protein